MAQKVATARKMKSRQATSFPAKFRQWHQGRELAIYSGYQSHAPSNSFFLFRKLSFGGRQSNVTMTITGFLLNELLGETVLVEIETE